MTIKPLARDELWDVATTQHGFVTAHQATEMGIDKHALQMLVHRGTLTRAAFGGLPLPAVPGRRVRRAHARGAVDARA